MGTAKRSLWSRIWVVGVPFFTSEDRWKAWLGLIVLLLLLLAVNGLNVVNSFVGRDLMTSLADREAHRFYVLAGVWIGVFAASTVVEVFNHYVEQRLGLVWRAWLTGRFLDRYLAHRTFRRLLDRPDVDNPDQRISDDVKTFTASSLAFIILIVNGSLTLLAFAGVLWSIAPRLFVAAVLYAALGSLGTILLGRPMVHLDHLQLQKEADFRYALVRLREHGGIGFGGPEGERTRLDRRLGAVLSNFRSIISVSRNLGFFTTGYSYLTQIIPAALVAPLYVHGEIEFGTVTQSAMAFTQTLGAFSLLITQFQQLSAYAAVVGRLGVMWEATEPDQSSAA